MKKALYLLLAAVMIVSMIAMAGCKGKDKDFTFKHGFDMEYPPYSYLQDDGTYGGFDIDLCKEVCKYYGWKYEPVPINWDAKKLELDSGAIDCIWSGFTIEGLENDYAWSKVYSNNTQVVLIKSDSNLKTLADLKGKLVGVQNDTSGFHLLNDGDQVELKNSFKELRTYDNFTVAVQTLKAGGIDAVAIDITAARHYTSQDSSLKIMDEVLGAETYGIGFRVNDTDLRDKVNKAIDALYKDGTFDKIAANYPDIKEFLCWE